MAKEGRRQSQSLERGDRRHPRHGGRGHRRKKGQNEGRKKMEREISEFGRNGMAVEKIAKDGTSNEGRGGGRRRGAEGEKVALQGARGRKGGGGDVRRAGDNGR